MKTQIYTLGLLLSLSTVSSAQINYEEINQRNASKINTEYQDKINKNQTELRKFFKTIFTIDSLKLKNNTPYSSIQLEQIKLVSCVREIVQKHKGGYDAPMVAQKLLLSAMQNDRLSSDLNVLNQATQECNTAFEKLYNFKEKAIDESTFINSINALPASVPAEIKAKKLITNISNNDNKICKIIGFEAEGYLVLGGGVGINLLKCLRTDGRIVNYVGPNLKLGLGFGAAAGVRVQNTKDKSFEVESGKVLAGSIAINDDYEGNIEAGVVFTKPISYYGAEDGLKVGVIAVPGSFNFNANVRVLNGKTQWHELLDVLK